jgi:YbbR domain-containing protein
VKLQPRYPVLFLVALVAAFLLWYGLAGQRREQISVRGFKLPLTLVNIPADLVLTSNVPDTVSVQLRGPLSRALENAPPMEILLDLANARPGVHGLPISEENLRLPSDVTIVSVDPAAITVELERLQVVALPVRPVLEGTPAPGFVLGTLRVAPQQINVQGPGSLLAALTEVETTPPISVEGATGAIEVSVQTQLPHPLLRTLTAVPILVVVEIIPEPTPEPSPTPTPRRSRR